MRCFVRPITLRLSLGDLMARNRLFIVVLWVFVSLGLVTEASSKAGALSVEKQLTDLIKDTYKASNDVLIKVERLPIQLREGAKVQGIDIVKLPEFGGAGLALIEYKTGSRVQSSYVAFRTYEKKQLFYVKRNMRKGERIEQADTYMKETYVGEKAYAYPECADDLRGKVFRRDIAAGSLITNSLLEEPQSVKRGQTVTILAQNKRLTVQVPGTAAQGGRRGDVIRVKNLSSGTELQGRIIDSGTVAVDF
jgi:flagellar basal body P-ring formation protein FlgA